MDKNTLLNQYAQDKDTRHFFASALDKLALRDKKNIPSSTGFFSPEERASFTLLLEKIPEQNHQWIGGFPSALRQICYVPASWEDEPLPPLHAIEGTCHSSIGHRDVLGSLMGLGLSRRKIGDILVEDNRCFVLVLAETSPLLLSQWEGVGRQNISLSQISLTDLPQPEQKTKEIFSTVASLRLDSLVATGFSLSRGKATTAIASGKVMLNHRPCQKNDQILQEGDLLTCRGLGNCSLTEVKGPSKKGRILVTLQRFI